MQKIICKKLYDTDTAEIVMLLLYHFFLRIATAILAFTLKRRGND